MTVETSEGRGRGFTTAAIDEADRQAVVRRLNDLNRDGTADHLARDAAQDGPETIAQFKERWTKQLAEVDATVAATWSNEVARNEAAQWSERAVRALEKERFQSVEVALAEASAIGRYYQQPAEAYEEAERRFREERPLQEQDWEDRRAMEAAGVDGRWTVQKLDAEKGVYVDVLTTQDAIKADEEFRKGREYRVLDNAIRDVAADYVPHYAGHDGPKPGQQPASWEAEYSARSEFATLARQREPMTLQEALDRRAQLAQAVADRSEAMTAAVDRVRDPSASPEQVQQQYETSARDYWQSVQQLREFEAKPSPNPEVRAKYAELQAMEAAIKQAEQAGAHARIDGDQSAEARAQQLLVASQAKLADFARREGVTLPNIPEAERNEIEHGLTPEQIKALMGQATRKEQKEAEEEQEKGAKRAATAAEAMARIGEGHNQVRDQSAFADAQAKDRLVPPEVTEAFKREGQKYVDAQDPKKVAFVDKGNRLQTIRTFDDRAVEAMVAVADARGWSEIKVSGDEAFRRKAWIEAAARGIEVKGYEPTEKDKARAEQLAKESGRANAIEKNEVLEAYRASRDGDPKERKEAARKHPELVNAFALEAAARSFAKQRLHPEAREAFVERIRENIERDLAQGKELPEVRRRQELDRKQDRGLDR